MTDRVPVYPGRVQLVPVTGQTNIYDMTMADQPTEAGTALNKANLLSDSAAAAVWPVAGDRPSDPTVSDALTLLGRKGKVLLADVTLTASIPYATPLSIPLAGNFEDYHQIEIWLINEAVDSTANGSLWLGERDADHKICDVGWEASSGTYQESRTVTILRNDSTGHLFAVNRASGSNNDTRKQTGAGKLTGNAFLLSRTSSGTLSLTGARLVIYGTRL